MKKLQAILNGQKFTDKLYTLREKEIRRKLEAAKDEQETIKATAEMEYLEAMNLLGDTDVNYEKAINLMLTLKQRIIDAEFTLKAIKEIENDLDEEVKE